MQIDRITCVCFSATGLTQKTADLFTDAFGAPVKKVDITPFSAEDVSLSFGPSELVVFAAPVYGGRIPAAAFAPEREPHPGRCAGGVRKPGL